MLEVKKQPKETTQRVVARFIQAVKKSGILIEAKKRMFRERPLSKFKKKKSALHRLKKKAEYERLEKIKK